MLGVAVGIAGSVSFDEIQQFMGRLGSQHGKEWSFCQKVFESSEHGKGCCALAFLLHLAFGMHAYAQINIGNVTGNI